MRQLLFVLGLMTLDLLPILCVDDSCNKNSVTSLCGQIHAFYYLWYGTPDVDGDWMHWNHKVLPHWRKEVNDKYPDIGVSFKPPASLHSPNTPLLGPYSSKNTSTIINHLLESASAGIDVLVSSWWGRPDSDHTSDSQGINTDLTLQLVVQEADKLCLEHGKCPVRVAIHLEPYAGRNIQSLANDIEYLTRIYSSSPSILRLIVGDDSMMVFYVYDSYHIPYNQWKQFLREQDKLGVFFGLVLDKNDVDALVDAGFDGGYTYFSSDGFSFGSSKKQWKSICKSFQAKSKQFMCNISVGPGYNDTKIRPWNAMNAKSRNGIEYYNHSFYAAMEAKPCIISITSFNEWGEGTQVEPSVEDNGMLLRHTRKMKDLYSIVA